MSEAMRGVIPLPTTLIDPPAVDGNRLPVACPVCAERVAVADVIVTPAALEVTISAGQHTLLDLHLSKFHPDRGDI